MRCTKEKVHPLDAGECWESDPVRVPAFGWAAFAVSSDVDGELSGEFSTDDGETWIDSHPPVHAPGWDAGAVRIDDPVGMTPLFRIRFTNGPKPQDLLEITVTVVTASA